MNFGMDKSPSCGERKKKEKKFLRKYEIHSNLPNDNCSLRFDPRDNQMDFR